MTEAPTANAPITLDSIMQSLAEMIQKADPEKIKIITEHMQAIIPAEDAVVNLHGGSSDEDKEVTMTFYVSNTKECDVKLSFEEVLKRLVQKTPFDKLERLSGILERLEKLNGREFDWDMSEPYYSKGAKAYACYLFVQKH